MGILKYRGDTSIAADFISTLEFDGTGDYLAAGDRGGRLAIYSRDGPGTGAAVDKEVVRRKDGSGGKAVGEYKFYAEFQSHEPEFDYLKSLEIEEKLNRIRWLNWPNASKFLLSTNDKTIKLWKVYSKQVKALTETNLEASRGRRRPGGLRVPHLALSDSLVAALPRRVFSNAHAYHINSISPNSDQETYLSADDLRINLWNINISDQSFNIVDVKPENMEELTEVITAAEFHPTQCNVFMYSSSKGSIKLADMRAAALCDQHSKIFEEPEDGANKSFFSEIIASVSDVKFSSDGRYILSRDYLALKLWDVNMENRPIKTIPIHQHLRSKLCDLYESDALFDKFEAVFSGDGTHMLTGSYHNQFHVFGNRGKTDCLLEASQTVSKRRTGGKKKMGLGLRKDRRQEPANPDTINFSRKVLHVGWHPHEDIFAVTSSSNILLFGPA